MSSPTKLVYLGLTAFMTGITCISAQLRFYIGPIPYTMQNFAIVLSGLVLPPFYALLSQLLYLLLIALGLPIAANFSGGLGVLLGYTAGYLWAFPIAAMLTSILSRMYLRVFKKSLRNISVKDVVLLIGLTSIAVAPVYLLGYIVFLHYAIPGSKLYAWANSVVADLGYAIGDPLTILFIASVLVFVPQDLLMDHLLAILVARGIVRLMESKGIELS